MSIMLRRKHSKAKRNVASFGLAIGSKHKSVECYKAIVIKYLNLIFDHTNELGPNKVKEEESIFQAIISEMYNLMNNKQVVSMIPSDINFMRR